MRSGDGKRLPAARHSQDFYSETARFHMISDQVRSAVIDKRQKKEEDLKERNDRIDAIDIGVCPDCAGELVCITPSYVSFFTCSERRKCKSCGTVHRITYEMY